MLSSQLILIRSLSIDDVVLLLDSKISLFDSTVCGFSTFLVFKAD